MYIFVANKMQNKDLIEALMLLKEVSVLLSTLEEANIFTQIFLSTVFSSFL